MRKLVLLLAFMAPLAVAQPPGPAVQTITPAEIASVVNLDGPWRFHFGDDPRFADPAFDDSGWPAIRTGQPFRSIGSPEFQGGDYIWARIHIRVPTGSGRLGISVDPIQTVQYEIFANGSPIASTPDMARRTPRTDWPFEVALPPDQDLVLAIRFYCRGYYWNLSVLPINQVSIGSLGAVQTNVELTSLRFFNNAFPALYASFSINLLIAIAAMLLYRLQRRHDEYLWLAITCFMFCLFALCGIAGDSGWVAYTRPLYFTFLYIGWLFNVADMEFFVRFTQVRRRWPIRVAQAVQLVPALLTLQSDIVVISAGFVVAQFLFTTAIVVCLVSAFRRGMPDSRLLLIPGVTAVSFNFAWSASLFGLGIVPWGTFLHFRHFGIELNHLGNLLFCLGIFAVVLFRFMRVTRDEQRAAAELEAARIVQQILVPEEIPTIPGFSIQAVYHPAGQVGGDFYQVLPTSNGGLLAIIGDVSGKGMPAAMTVSLLVGTVRTLAHFTQDPAEILTAMNQRMLGRGSGFTTALVLRLDPDGTLTAANAGHLAPYASGKELQIDNGLPLGITAASEYANTTLHLASNTTLTLLTDGVVEAQNDRGELFGFDRTAAISSKPAQTVADAAQAFGQEDDITVLSLALTAGA